MHLPSAIFKEAITFHRRRGPRDNERPRAFARVRSQVNAAFCRTTISELSMSAAISVLVTIAMLTLPPGL